MEIVISLESLSATSAVIARQIGLPSSSLYDYNSFDSGMSVPAIPFQEAAYVKEYVEPLGMRLLIRRDEARQKTRGGIVLPDDAEIPTITGRVVEVSAQVEHDEDFPISKYDKVLFHPKHAIPVDFESDNLLFVVPIDDVVAVFRRDRANSTAVENADESDEFDPFDDLGS